MKKTLILLLIMISLFIGGCSNKEESSTEDNNNQVEQKGELVVLSFDELQAKIDNKDSFILVVTQTTCSHCAEYRPILTAVLEKYNVVAYEIESDKLTTEERGLMNDIANVSGTPTTIFIEDGVETTTTNRIVGPASQSKLVAKLTSMGYIKE